MTQFPLVSAGSLAQAAFLLHGRRHLLLTYRTVRLVNGFARLRIPDACLAASRLHAVRAFARAAIVAYFLDMQFSNLTGPGWLAG
jgi:hypothetical protein